MQTRAFLIHALSPLHAGVGQAADIIDLPIARMKATGIPFVPGSSIKGVLRDARRADRDANKVLATFGPETNDAHEHAGALVVGDARLLALPVRSFKGTFAWVSSPLLLALAQRDLGTAYYIPPFEERGAVVTRTSCCVQGGRLYLEDLDIPADESKDLDGWTGRLAALTSPGADIFSKRFVVVDDDTMTFLWETCTQIDTRVRLKEETRTVAQGALWLEESLPPETLLIGLLGADKCRREGVTMSGDEVLEFANREPEILQLGGKATIGRGRCRMSPMLPQPPTSSR